MLMRMKRTLNILPSTVVALMSPYPTVDMVTMKKYRHSPYVIFWGFEKLKNGSPEFSIYGPANTTSKNQKRKLLKGENQYSQC
jgi:hypothetical protein